MLSPSHKRWAMLFKVVAKRNLKKKKTEEIMMHDYITYQKDKYKTSNKYVTVVN